MATICTRIFVNVILLASFATFSIAQTVTGTISGSVVDPSGLAVAGAKGVLRQVSTGDKREFTPDSSGLFVITGVPPGQYALTVEFPGFKKFEKTNLVLSQAERMSVGRLRLEVGNLTESVTVQAVGAAVEVESNDRTQMLTGDQMQTMQSRGRNYLSLLTTLPGVAGFDNYFETNGFQNTATPTFNGVDAASNSVLVDGSSSASANNPTYSYSLLSMESVAEVKVSTANYRAEDGRNGGAIIKTITKSGSKDFKGSAYYFFRNEDLNANAYINKMNHLPRDQYRFNVFGGTIGGPIYFPGKFNSQKDKLFFFFSSDTGPTKSPYQLTTVTMPTALERAGDFSQTVDQNNKQVPINDPQNNKLQFPGNVIPKNRINAAGQALLSVFPDANFFNRAVSAGNYNYTFSDIRGHYTYLNMAKVDYNPTSKLRVSGRASFWHVDDPSYASGGVTWDMLKANNAERSLNTNLNSTYTVSPSMVNELNLSYRRQYFQLLPVTGTTRLDRARLGVNLKQLYPGNNSNNFIPSMSFANVPGAASLTPPVNLYQKNGEPLMTLNESISKIHGTHTFKFGFSWEYLRQDRPSAGNLAGSLDFSRDANNPFDSNWAYSNALLGNFRSYSETDSHPNYHLRSTTVDWYAQDTWKATRRLTLDCGMRFTSYVPWHQSDRNAMNFEPNLYDPKKAVTLFRPALNSARVRMAQDPTTGAFYPASYIGAIVPNSGTVLNGMVSADAPGVPTGFINNPGILFGPRAGFAYDLFGDGKTAIRGGFGISYTPRSNIASSNAGSQSNAQGTIDNTQNTPTQYYGNLDTFSSAAGVVFPRTVWATNPNLKTPTVMSYSFGVQRTVLKGTILDVAYVATLCRELSNTKAAINTTPFGTNFLPSSLDATVNSPLPVDFLRPYVGYTNISIPQATSSNYHSLQAQLNRRFTRSLRYSVAYTFSKAMGYYGNYGVYFDNHLNYGKLNFDHTHMVSINYTYELPKGSRIWNVAPMRFMFDGWETSGTATLQDGRPFMITYSYGYGAPDITGGGDYNRVFVIQNPNLSYSDRTVDHFFNTKAFLQPFQKGVFPGNAPNDTIRGPGKNNWDMTIAKTYRLFRESKTVQLRGEFYNIFNHPSWNSLDLAARFDQLGNNTNARFGKSIAALTPRCIQLVARFSF